jgi:uncharacterized protein (DUF885 family)
LRPTFLVLLLSLLPAVGHADGPPTLDVEHRRKALDSLLKEEWEYHLRTNPEFASIIGDKRYNDRLSDFSQAFIDRDLRATAAFLGRFEAIDTSGFPAQEKLNQELMVRQGRTSRNGRCRWLRILASTSRCRNT